MKKLIIKALTGPVKGKAFPINQGLKIGRTSGDVLLKDPLVSGFHAEIQVYSDGRVVIVDKDSKNKITMNRRTIVKSILEEGARFHIGKTEFEVVEQDSPEEVLSEFMKTNSEFVKDEPNFLKPLAQAIELTFLSGLQEGQKYHLFYGPRFFGANSVDFPIFEKTAPREAFSIIPEDLKSFFITQEPELVRFNEEAIEKSQIKNGDKVFIGSTSLEFTLK